MILKANTVDWGAVGLDELDDVESGARFVTRGFDGAATTLVVRFVCSSLNLLVVVVKFRVGVCSRGGSECDGEVCLADGLKEDIVAQRSTAFIRDGLIDNIPGVALALVMSYFLGDMLFEDFDQRGVVEAAF